MGTVTLLKNSTGLFIIQCLRREYQAHIGREISWGEIVEVSQSYTGEPMVFDVNDPAFFNPSSMARAVWSYLVQSGQCSGEIHWPALIQSVYNALACSYAVAVEELEEVTRERYTTIYVVGGGSQVDYLNQLCADVTGRTVVTGAQESTSLGSIGIQLRYYDPSLSLQDIRKVLSGSVKGRRFTPRDRAYGEKLAGACRRLAR